MLSSQLESPPNGYETETLVSKDFHCTSTSPFATLHLQLFHPYLTLIISYTPDPSQQAQLSQIFAEAPPNPTDQTTIAPVAVRTAYHKIINPNASDDQVNDLLVAGPEPRLPDEGDDCAVCYDGMEVGGKGKNALTYDLGVGGCGKGELNQQCGTV